MPEYIGYQGRAKGVDWAGIADKAITGYNTIQKDRDEQRASLEKSADDLVTASKNYKPGQSNVFNEKILEGADRVRTNTLDLKKELMAGRITPTEYKARVGKMSGDWKLVGDFAKSYNDIITKNTEYLNDPKASALGAYMLEKQAGLSDLSGKNFVVDQSGSIVLSDPNTGMVVDFMSMLNPENQTPPKLDVISEVERFTKGLGETSKYVGGLWTTSPILKTDNEYQKAKANFTKSLLQNPRGAASILSDYVGGYDFYETPQQKKDIEAAGGRAIQLVQGPNGIVTPKLTADQEKEARAVLDRLVDSRVDVKKEQPRPVETTKADSGGDGGKIPVNITNRERKLDELAADLGKANSELKGTLEGSTVELIKMRPRKAGGYFYDIYGYQMIPGDKGSITPAKRLDQKGPRTRIKTVNHTQIKDVYNNILNNKSDNKEGKINYEDLYQGNAQAGVLD
jgi:hypothetical protein